MTSSICAIYAIILGMVEGITEFLPVSSTGHLIELTDLLQFRETGGTFEIGIQLGAVMAVLWFYRDTLVGQARTVLSDAKTQRFWLGIVLAFIPAGGIGFLLANYITTYYSERFIGDTGVTFPSYEANSDGNKVSPIKRSH
jgi:undecaprenyl-diphosphatase